MVLKTRFQLIRTVAVIGWVGPALLLAACGDGDGRSCLPLEDTYCQEGVVYRVNSCGELEEVLEHCHCGCSPDHTVCIADCGSFCDKDGNCENREDCWSCPEDCGCDDGLVCSRITRSCQDCSDDCGSRECGPVPNGCGESCGHGCDDGYECVDGRCKCQPDCDGKQCGTDGCGGTCEPGCAGNYECDDQGQCRCEESDTGLCRRHGRECGAFTAVDLCGHERTVADCGRCTGSDVCSAQGLCVCQPETDTDFCSRLDADCGNVTGTDNCGNARTVNCGGCDSPNTCGGAGVANECGCTPESDTDFCAVRNLSCGSASGYDSCGEHRQVKSCGTCTHPNTCNSGTCTCIDSESTAQFCARMGAECGAISGLDLCGQTRSANCGECTHPDTCAGGGHANMCGCTPESDTEFCAALGWNCGTATALDNCDLERTADCGTCSGVDSCGGGGVPGQCGCSAESDGDFCDRIGAECGELTAVDNCGQPRTVGSCGGCSPPDECSANRCECPFETDAEMCERHGKTCGVFEEADICGDPRTVHCGSCASGDFCSDANVCVAHTPWPNAGICTATGAHNRFCELRGHMIDVTLYDVWEDPSGLVWAAGGKGTVVSWDGYTVRGFTGLAKGNNLTGIWAGSATDVWAVNDDFVIHFNGHIWQNRTPASVGTDNINDILGFGPDDVWIVGANRLLMHWDGDAWSDESALIAGMTDYYDLDRIVGNSPDDVAISNHRDDVWRGSLSTGFSRVIDMYDIRIDSLYFDSTGALYVGYHYWSDGWYKARGKKIIGDTVTSLQIPEQRFHPVDCSPSAIISGLGDTDIDLVLSQSRLYHYDGFTWTKDSDDLIPRNYFFCCTKGGSGQTGKAIYAGTHGLILRKTASGWQGLNAEFLPPRPNGVNSIFSQIAVRGLVPLNGGKYFVLTDASDSRFVWGILDSATGTWTHTGYSNHSYYSASAAVSPDGNEIWFATNKSSRVVDIYHFDGTTWQTQEVPPDEIGELYSADASSIDDVWFSGKGAMIHYDGLALTSVTTPFSGTTTGLSNLVALTPAEAFVVGGMRELLVWDGHAWTIDPTMRATDKLRLWKTPAGDLFSLRDGDLWQWRSGAWWSVPYPDGFTDGDILWGRSGSDLHITTSDKNKTASFDGSQWSIEYHVGEWRWHSPRYPNEPPSLTQGAGQVVATDGKSLFVMQ